MTLGALWWFVRRTDLHALAGAFGRAAPWPLAGAALLNLAGQYLSAEGWRVMLGRRHPVPLRRLVRYEFTAQAASAISPARAGELIRLWLLRRESVPAGTTTALIWLEKLCGAVGLAALALPVPWLLPGVPGVVTGCVAVFAAVMAGQLLLLVAVARRGGAGWLPGWLPGSLGRVVGGLADGLYVLRRSRPTLALLALLLAGEVCDAGGAAAVLVALRVHLPAGSLLPAAVLVLFLVDVSNLMPIAPGHLVTFEVGALYALSLLRVPPDAALAFTLLFHAQQLLPQTAVGLPFQVRLLAARRAPAPAAAAPDAHGTR